MRKPKKIPMRMCVGCREMKPKLELVRIVKPQDGPARLDATMRAAGRGAYVCHNVECLLRAKKSRALERALSCPIEDDVFEQLKYQLEVQK